MDSDVKCCLGVILVFLVIVIVVVVVFQPPEPDPIETKLYVVFYDATVEDGIEYNDGRIIISCDMIIPENESDDEDSRYDGETVKEMENATLEINITHDNITEKYVRQTDFMGRVEFDNLTPGEYTVSVCYAGNKTYNSSYCIETDSIELQEVQRTHTSSSSSESSSNEHSSTVGYSSGGYPTGGYSRGYTYYRWVYV